MRAPTLSSQRISQAIALFVLGIAACSPPQKITVDDPHWVDLDRKSIPVPAKSDPGLAWSSFDRSFTVQAEQLFDFNRHYLKLSGNPRQSLDINSYDLVPNSAWFTNRHGLLPMSPGAIATSDGRAFGPDTAGTWILSRPKVGGATPGFWIQDRNGNRFIIKFDPAGYPEMATAAEVMGTRFFYACGYNVPYSTIVNWHPDKLRIKKELEFKDEQGKHRPFLQADLEAMLSQITRQPDGAIRSSASPLLPNAMGPFKYDGRRRDDPNDWCPHEDRRELRALYVMASLVNHYDTKDQNSLDIFVETDGGGYVKHHLIDFGSAFGSDGDGAKHPRKGYANWFDLRDVFVSTITLGLKSWGWESGTAPDYPSIGYFESTVFEPQKFDPIVPNPAFDEMTARDAFWGARIVMAFEEKHLRAIVDAGQFSDPEAADYLLKTLMERREKIGRHWFDKVNPLDVVGSTSTPDELTVAFEDLAVRYGLEDNGRYRFRVRYRDDDVIPYRDLSTPSLRLNRTDLGELVSRYQVETEDDPSESHLYEIQLETRRSESGWSKPLRLFFWYHPDEQRFALVGIVHQD